ncbi:pentatricopeptide repeat protein-like protein [Periconia macrospinosa]|uniref:Pentatricopeptide repeat protein-like protein n=1 Tax=Periconia macrospinosa TaxID=97972 RepID=A0A2V1E7X3_9PLEO|nr:pentatricopeptide repeat protein-like protein [Periconia macrospinosa]
MEEKMVGDLWLGKRDPRIPAEEWNARKKELQWLKDPLEVAGFVKKELRKDKEKEMIQLVRMASHSMQCTVSWNHIIDHYMAQGKVSNAMKTFTEMKKRAQFPDSYTYTIILRGLSNNVGKSEVISKALAVYYSMSAPNSQVQPTILHTNAVLLVCARALDMDALWSVVAKLPQSGPGSANQITYTTILSAIKQSLIVNVPTDESAEEVAARREKGVVEGRRIWEEIVAKWRSGDLVMEEALVCSMARLLLVGSRPQDWDDVLSLIEQTMDIPRFVPRLGSRERLAAGVPPLRAPYTPTEFKGDDHQSALDNEHKRGDEFLAILPHGVGKSSLIYATPGQNTLSAVMEACQKLVAFKAADEYWKTITDRTTYRVVPDVDNLHHRLRVLRQFRASTAALTLLEDDFVSEGLEPWPATFRIIMSTCVRDKNNHNSLRTANKVLQLMLRTLHDVDLRTVDMYARLAVSFPLANGDDLIESLSVLQPILNSIRLQMGVGAEDSEGRKGAVQWNRPKRQEALDVLRKIYAIYDKLLRTDLIAQKKQAPFIKERARLSAYMARVIDKYRLSVEDMARPRKVQGDGEASFEKKRGGGWRANKAQPEENRRPWSSTLGTKRKGVEGGGQTKLNQKKIEGPGQRFFRN